MLINPANNIIDKMWDFLKDGKQKGNPEALKEYVYDLIKIMTQKTAGQRKNKPKDVSFDDLDMIYQGIIIEALCLVLDARYDEAFANIEQANISEIPTS